MEAIGKGLEAIGHALASAATGFSVACITLIIGVVFLVFKDKISIEDIKDFFKKDKRYR